jgi:hypothetical protein
VETIEGAVGFYNTDASTTRHQGNSSAVAQAEASLWIPPR